jgi:hypothetical protein
MALCFNRCTHSFEDFQLPNILLVHLPRISPAGVIFGLIQLCVTSALALPYIVIRSLFFFHLSQNKLGANKTNMMCYDSSKEKSKILLMLPAD